MIARWKVRSGPTTSDQGASAESAVSVATAPRASAGTTLGFDHEADGLDLERGAQLEDVFDVCLGEDRHLDTAVGLAAQQAFADQDLGRGAEGVAGDAEALGEVVLAQTGARGELTVEDQVSDRVGRRLYRGHRRDPNLGRTGDLNGFWHVLDYSTI